MNNTVVHCVLCPPNAPAIPIELFDKHKKLVHETHVINPNEVQFYSEHVKALAYTQQHKIAKLMQGRCIEYASGGVYICKPIATYNKTTYRLQKNGFDEWACSCQFYVTHEKLGEADIWCAHKGALYEYFARGQKY
jgi:hypothetical protein